MIFPLPSFNVAWSFVLLHNGSPRPMNSEVSFIVPFPEYTVTEDPGRRIYAGKTYGSDPVLSESVQPDRRTNPSPRFVRRTHSLFRLCRSSPGASNCIALLYIHDALPICGTAGNEGIVQFSGTGGRGNEGSGRAIC